MSARASLRWRGSSSGFCRASRAPLLAAGFLGTGFLVTGCAVPVRVPLPAPYGPTEGATPVPARGAGVGLHFAGALRGPELEQSGVTTYALTAGVADRVSGSVALFQGSQDQDPSGSLLRLKVLAAQPFGPRTALGVHLATGAVSRRDGDAQDDRLRTWDLALPLEFLLTGDEGQGVALYAGPRLMVERYTDRLNRGQGADLEIPGLVRGFHTHAGGLHVFLEGTLARLPENEYLGVRYGGRTAILPSAGVALHLGPPYRWRKR